MTKAELIKQLEAARDKWKADADRCLFAEDGLSAANAFSAISQGIDKALELARQLDEAIVEMVQGVEGTKGCAEIGYLNLMLIPALTPFIGRRVRIAVFAEGEEG